VLFRHNIQACFAAYTEEGEQLGTPIPVARDESAPSYGGVQMNLYRQTLEGMKPGTKYQYEVTLADGETCSATFSTLAEQPDEVKFMSISDTHKFKTKDAFNDAVFAYNPAFWLHAGDMVEGTSTQKEQFNFWFGSGDFIHSYPVVYACGNHDFSDYFDAYVLQAQVDAVSGNEKEIN